MTMKECEKDKCALGLIHPNSATHACDEECYFSYTDKKTKDSYIKTHPEEMSNCGWTKRGTK